MIKYNDKPYMNVDNFTRLVCFFFTLICLVRDIKNSINIWKIKIG